MKNLIAIALLFISSVISAQDQYTKGMQKAFQLWGEGKTQEASNMFDRISMAEQDEWLPNYYIAQVNTISAFTEKDKEKLGQLLQKAQEAIDIAKAISPDNPEIMVQQAMIYTAWVASDGATYGMEYSPKVVAIYNKAMAMAPSNPRVVLSKAEWGMGSAKYFGQDTTPYCNEIERSLELFANFKPESPLHPNWGKERAEEVLSSCGK